MFIHSPVDKHLGCFHFLSILSNAVITLANKYLFEFLFPISLGIIPKRGIAGSNSNSMFNFLRNHQTVFIVAALFYTPVMRVQGFQFLHIFVLTCCFVFVLFLVIGILLGVMWLSYCGFDLHFFNG